MYKAEDAKNKMTPDTSNSEELKPCDMIKIILLLKIMCNAISELHNLAVAVVVTVTTVAFALAIADVFGSWLIGAWMMDGSKYSVFLFFIFWQIVSHYLCWDGSWTSA
jgi:uncharacterized membrane protein